MSTRSKAEELMDQVNATFKQNVVQMASDPKFIVDYQPTDVLPFDILTGGLARGRFYEIYGDSSTLKSWVGYCAIAATQARGETAALIDLEHSFDPIWAASCGVDVSQLIMPPAESIETGEQAFDLVETLVRGKCNLIVFDSIGAILAQAHKDKRLAGENPKIAATASLMSIALRKITAPNSVTAILFINQLRTNVGMTFGDPNIPTGGKSLPFYASQRVSVKKQQKVTMDITRWNGDKMAPTKQIIGQRYLMTLEKSKLNIPLRTISFSWSMSQGAIDMADFLITESLNAGYITVKGATWTVNGTAWRAVGKEKFKKLVLSDQELMNHLEDLTRTTHNLSPRLGIPIQPVKSKAARAKQFNSVREVPSRTRTVARAKPSKVTEVPAKTLSSSKTLTKPIKSLRKP